MISRFRRRKCGCIILGIILAIPVFSGGCMIRYEQRGKTQADFDRDKKYCEQVGQTEYKRKGTRVCDEIDACLKARGWKADSPSLW
ncbi:MAG: hypothetical protein ACYDHW_07645 [Syntrophorhabdaceae bacterium]